MQSQEEQQSFMRSVAHMTGPEAVARAKETYEHYESAGEYWNEGGEFQPLGVWGARGYDVARIEANSHPSDRRDHPVLGQTFRIRILSSGMHGERGQKRTSGMEASQPKKMARQQLALEANIMHRQRLMKYAASKQLN
jgi:hypothetical protein